MTRRLASIVVVALAAFLPAAAPAPVPATPTAVAEVREYEVRLRKLYMVRPDLLQYPVPYDVVC